MNCDRECEACPHADKCMMGAAVEYRDELAGEARDEHICAACSCHGNIAARLAVLEDRWATLQALFERMGADA